MFGQEDLNIYVIIDLSVKIYTTKNSLNDTCNIL
jgi:hypothetical protein